jgi:hypothetical protein
MVGGEAVRIFSWFGMFNWSGILSWSGIFSCMWQLWCCPCPDENFDVVLIY